MADPNKPAHGTLLSILDWLDHEAEIPRNLLRGNVGAAGRHLADFVSGPIRALIPGDQSSWELTTPEDNVHTSDLVGVDRKEHPWGALGTDMLGDTALDPLTYLSFGALPAIKGLAKGAEATTAIADAAKVAEGAEGVADASKIADAATGAEKADVAGGLAKDVPDPIVDSTPAPEAAAANLDDPVKDGLNGGVALRVPFTKIGTDFAFQGNQLDPLHLVGQGLGAAKDLLPDGMQSGIDQALFKTKSALGWLRANPTIAAAIAKGDAWRKGVSQAHMRAAAQLLQDLPEEVASRIPGIVDPAHPPGSPEAAASAANEERFAPMAQQKQNWQDRLAADPDIDPDTKALLSPVLDQYGDLSQQQWSEAHRDFPGFTQADGKNPDIESPADYVPRDYTGKLAGEDKEFFGRPKPAMDRSLPNGASLGEYLAANPDIQRVTDMKKLLNNRAASQGDLANKAIIGKSILGDDFVSVADKASVAKVNDYIYELAKTDPESSYLLKYAFNGIPKRTNPIAKTLAFSNGLFKRAAVAGSVVPKIGSAFRNSISHPMQLGATGGLADEAWKQLMATPQTLWQGIKSGLEKYTNKTLPGDKVSDAITLLHQASEHTGGRFSEGLKWLRDQGRDDVASALENGVIDNGYMGAQGDPDFLKQGIKAVAGKLGAGDAGQKRLDDILSAPAEVFSGSENSARMRLFMERLAKGDTPEQAASTQREAFYNYGQQTPEHRALRDAVPFASFTAGALRQQANGFSRNPGIHSILGDLYGGDDTGPVDNFTQDEMRVPLGQGRDGQDHYLSGLAQPVETIGEVPNLTGNDLHNVGKQIQETLISSSSPVIKSLWGLISGEDPYFHSAYGSYDRIPAIGNEGKAGQLYNSIAQTGAIQPIDSLLRTVDKATDPRKDTSEKLIESLTGAHIIDVDESRAIMDNLKDQLEADPNAHQGSDYWSKDPDTQKLIEEYRRVKAAERGKKKADHVSM